LTVDGSARFIDFEHAALGNGLLELAYLRIGFPTCWNLNIVAPSEIDEAETAYRSIHGAVSGDVADHCVSWLLRSDALVERARRDGRDHFEDVVRRDWTWGFVSARQRLVHRLDVVARLPAPHLEQTTTLARRLHDRMLLRWPDAGRARDGGARVT
jgi:hypothetical protein